MTNDRKKLNLITPLIIFGGFLIILFLLFSILNNFDKSRKDEVYQTYAAETENYINKNKSGLIELFNIFNQEAKPCVEIFGQPSTCPQVLSNQEQINKLITHYLKDWSSTGFIIKTSNNGELRLIRLSGDIHELNMIPEKRSLVDKLLNGERSNIPWDDYTYEFQDKEIIIPVQDENRKIIGAIIRGVIQEGSF